MRGQYQMVGVVTNAVFSVADKTFCAFNVIYPGLVGRIGLRGLITDIESRLTARSRHMVAVHSPLNILPAYHIDQIFTAKLFEHFTTGGRSCQNGSYMGVGDRS
jgi:hypothetical protein